MKYVNSDACHDILAKEIVGRLSFNACENYPEWKSAVRDRLFSLLGMDKISSNACEAEFEIECEEQKEGYKQIRFSFYSERGSAVPCYLLIPDTGKEKYPVAILLQGHSTGFHLSIGKSKWSKDANYQPRAAFGIQAVNNGFAALLIEQRYMGERRSFKSYGKDNQYYDRPHMCAVGALTAFNLGRTPIGERVWDVKRAIDMLSNFKQLDLDKILISGNSGGGTASFYAACYDERIKYSAPSCSFCSFRTSIMPIEHCACNYVPGIMEYFEMEDLSCLIAPRSLTVIAGKEDDIFPIEGVREAFETVKRIYNAENASGKCRLVETPMGHRWCDDIAWSAIKEETDKLGWWK